MLPWWTVVDKNSNFVKIHDISKTGLQYAHVNIA